LGPPTIVCSKAPLSLKIATAPPRRGTYLGLTSGRRIGHSHIPVVEASCARSVR
jgi:hypothetical protein